MAHKSTEVTLPHRALGHVIDYNDDFDASYCATCRVWIEEACGDPECRFCSMRPEIPPVPK